MDVFIVVTLLGKVFVDVTNPTPGCSVRGVLSYGSPGRTTVVDNSMSIILLVPHCLVVVKFTLLTVCFFGRSNKVARVRIAQASFRAVLPRLVAHCMPSKLTNLLLTKLLTTFVSAFTSAIGTTPTCVIGSVCLGCVGPGTDMGARVHDDCIVSITIMIIDAIVKFFLGSVGRVFR